MCSQVQAQVNRAEDPLCLNKFYTYLEQGKYYSIWMIATKVYMCEWECKFLAIQFSNGWIDLDEIEYGCRVYLRITHKLLFNRVERSRGQ